MLPLNLIRRAEVVVRRDETLGTIMGTLAGIHGSRRLVEEAVRAGGGDVEYVERLADVPSHLVPSLRSGDTLVLMGAGDVATIWTDIVDEIGDSP